LDLSLEAAATDAHASSGAVPADPGIDPPFPPEEPPPPEEAPAEAFDGPRIEPREPSPFEPEPVALAERQAATEALATRILARLNP